MLGVSLAYGRTTITKITIFDIYTFFFDCKNLTSNRYEIRDIKLPERVQEAMQMQVEAERRKRAQVLESEGVREAAINVAEGQRQSRILASEAQKIEQINKAEGLATALKTEADGKAEALRKIGERIRTDGLDAAALNVAEQYIEAFGQLARNSSTLILPKDAGNVSNMVGQAMQIYKTISSANTPIQADPTSEYYSDPEDQKSSRK